MNTFHKIFKLLILFLASIILLYTFYRSEIVYNGLERKNYIIFYSLSILLIIVYIFFEFSNTKVKEYIIILSISFIFAAYLFEYYLINQFYTANLSQKELIEIKSKKLQNKNFDKRSLFEVYKDKKNKNPNVVVRMYPTDNLYNKHLVPLSGISNSLTIHCNENGYYSEYISDRYGFNNPNEEWDQEEIEYILIGDSFTHGECVNRPNDFGSILRSLSKKNILNLGYGGNGPLIQYATIKEYIRPQVKKVLWIYYSGNDLDNLNSELKSEILSKYFFEENFSQNLINKQNISDNLLIDLMNKAYTKKKNDYVNQNDKKKFRNEIKFLKLYSFRNFLLTYFENKNIKKNNLDKFKNILKKTKRILDKNNTKLYFVYLPSYDHLKYATDDKNLQEIKNILNNLDIDLINIKTEVFDKNKDNLSFFPFRMKGHYTVDGYRLIGKVIYESIK